MIDRVELQIRRDVQYLAGNLPHRGAYTESEHRAAEFLRERLLEHTPDVELDTFYSVESYHYVFASYYMEFIFVAIVAIWMPAVAFFYGLVVFLGYLAEFTTYRLAARIPALSQYESQNVIARFLSPHPLRLFIVTAHYDSPREGLLTGPGVRKGLRAVQYVLVLCMMTVLVTCLVEWFNGGTSGALGFYPMLRWIAVTCLVAAGGALVIHEWTGEYSNGAVDNASGVAALLALAERIRRSSILDGAEVWLVATGAKDAWMSGMYHFVKSHELDRENTYFLHLDRVGEGELHYVKGEGLLHLFNASREMLDAAEFVAEDFGARPCLNRGMPSDALVTMARGYKSLSIAGQELSREGERLPEPPDALPRVDYAAIARATGFAEGILRQLALALARHESEATATSRP